MSDEEVQLQAKSSLKAFDDAKSESGFANQELARVAIRDLMAFIDHWKGKVSMKPQNVDLTGGGHDDLRQYAENQIKSAEGKIERDKSELTLVKKEAAKQ